MGYMGYGMKRIAVTGANGYLGKQIISTFLSRGIKIFPIVRNQNNSNEIVCDLTDKESVEKAIISNNIDTIIHCAAMVPKKWEQYDEDNCYNQNIIMLQNIAHEKLKRLIFCSSMTVYGVDAEGMIDESSATSASNAYSKSKLDCEEWLQKKYKGDYVIARLPGLFGGSRQSGLIYNLILSLSKQELPELVKEPPAWSALHVDDAADLMYRLATFPLENNIVCNLGYGIPQSIYRLLLNVMALMKLDDFPVQNISDNWVCLNINRQLRNIGFTSRDWFQRLAQEISTTENIS